MWACADYFNGPHTAAEYIDARLTPLGQKQGIELQSRLLDLDVDLVVVSTLSRAIQTAEIGFSRLPIRPNFIATELCRERISSYSCDQRRSKSELVTDFPSVDLREVRTEEDEMWLQKEDQPSASDSEVATIRAGDFLEWLMRRPEKSIAVVSHWVFLQHLFREFNLTDSALELKGMGNAEVRTMALCSGGPNRHKMKS